MQEDGGNPVALQLEFHSDCAELAVGDTGFVFGKEVGENPHAMDEA